MITNKTIREVVISDKLFPGGSGEPTYDTRTASGAIATFNTNVVKPLRSLTAQIVPVQEGTGDPSPSNPRPISGTSVLNVTRTGKNLFDRTGELENRYINTSGIAYTASGWIASDFIPVKPSTTYYFKPNSTAGNSAKIAYYDINKDFISYIDSGEQSFTTLSICYFMRFSYRDSSSDIQLELGSTATTYSPYTGSTYPISLGQTVYGGSAEVVEGEGEETFGFVDMGSLEWTSTSFGGNPVWRTPSPDNCKGYGDSSIPSIYCEKYKPTTVDSVYQGTQSYGICIRGSTDFIYVTREDSNSPTGKLVYELATPTAFTFTGQEINSLEGVNNVWTDTGDTEVSYLYQTGTETTSKVNKWLPIFYPIRKGDT